MSNAPGPVPLSLGDPVELSSVTPEPVSGSPERKGELPPPVTGGRGWYNVGPRSQTGDFWVLAGCNAIVFGASVCIMVLELTASRLIANYVGQSLYTWTSVIGVVLAGISIGNYVGGYLADRFDPRTLLSRLFLLAGLLTMSVLFMNGWAAGTPRPERMHWQLWVMFVVGWVFFLPALALGTISPVTASMALKRSAKTGMTVGNIYAWGALGSIVGTFLAGFWLIGEFGSRQVISMTAGVLVLIGALVAGRQRGQRTAALLGALPLIAVMSLLSSTTAEGMSKTTRFLAGIRSGWRTGVDDFAADEKALSSAIASRDDRAARNARETTVWRQARAEAENAWAEWGQKFGGQVHALGLTLGLRKDDPRDYNDESDYYSIHIGLRNEYPGDRVKQLQLDHLIHSYYDPDSPLELHYPYEKVYAAITERAAALRRTETPLENFPHHEEMTEHFPSTVTYDSNARKLSVRGVMPLEDLRHLLSIGPYAPFWEAVIGTWDRAQAGSARASRSNGGVILTPLAELPAGVRFPESLAGKLRYDKDLEALVCTAPFDQGALQDLLIQGEMTDYLKAVQALFGASRKVSVMFIGGGGFIFPRWIEATFPDEPRIDVAEIDPAVRRAVETALELPPEPGPGQDGPDEDQTWIRTRFGDARNFVDDRLRENAQLRAAGLAPITYDFVYGDAFNDLSVPWHLTTAEFSRKIRELLTPERGAYLVNIVDIYPRTHYPPKSAKVGKAEIEFWGELPASLAPETIPAEGFVACRGEFKALEIGRSPDGGYRLRCTQPMSKETARVLKELELTTDPNGGRFASAIADLYTQTNLRSTLPDPIPAAILNANPPRDANWRDAPEPFASLQVHRFAGSGYLLGLRGVMSDQMRKNLLALPDAGPEFKQGVEGLYRASRLEKVGRFLGRYVHTARKIFPCVYVFNSDEHAPGEDRDTLVVACSLQKIDFTNLESSGGHWRTPPFAWTEPGAEGPVDYGEMSAVLELARNTDLTDDFAPVDNLLAPVFVRRDSERDE